MLGRPPPCLLQALSQSHPSGIQPHTQLQLPEWLSRPAASLLTEVSYAGLEAAASSVEGRSWEGTALGCRLMRLQGGNGDNKSAHAGIPTTLGFRGPGVVARTPTPPPVPRSAQASAKGLGRPVKPTGLFPQLLQFDPARRLGAGGGGVDKLKAHPFFSSTQWSKLGG